MSTHAHPLGARVAALRRARGWSQRRLAEAAGVSHGYIAQLELGRLPSASKRRLDAVAQALDLATADALLGADADDVQPDATPTTGSAATRQPIGPAAGSSASSRSRSRGSSGSNKVATGVVGTTSTRSSSAAAIGNDSPGQNVAGLLEQVRTPGARLLPVFRWGSCGDPRDRESPPDPDYLDYPPPGRETLIGTNGFGVVIKGESMAGRGIHDGDVVWVNPDRPYGLGKVVLALASDVGGEAGMVVKTFARTEVGECLVSETAQGRSPLVCREFRVIGPVVGITSWRLPS